MKILKLINQQKMWVLNQIKYYDIYTYLAWEMLNSYFDLGWEIYFCEE
jgi:hypothetical protein